MFSETQNDLRVMRTAIATPVAGLLAGLMSWAPVAHAQTRSEPMAPTLNTFGSTGLVEMPTGEHQPDGEITTTVSHFAGAQRYTVSFQILPRLSGSFRYSVIPKFNKTVSGKQYDRSFDLRYKVLDEGRYVPAVTIGMQDFIGTGIYSGEYIVATKTLHPTLKATVGVGWGRFSDQRRRVKFGQGGSISAGNWFKGDANAFAGLEWKTPIKGLNLKLEYSADHYLRETVDRSIFKRKSQVNFGLDYKVSESTHLSLYYLYGSEVGVQLSFALNPKRNINPSGFEGASLPVATRPKRGPAGYDTAWAAQPEAVATALQDLVKQVLGTHSMYLEALHLEADRAKVYIRNDRYYTTAQAVGRAARGMTRVLPPSIESIEIIPIEQGLPVVRTVFRRTALEQFEHVPDGAEQLLQRTEILPAGRTVHPNAVYAEKIYPSFNWSLKPYLRASFFDPDTPIRADVGLRLRGRYDVAPGLSFSGSIIKPIAGNIDKSNGVTTSLLPRVRSNATRYFAEGDPALEQLTADYVFKMSPEVYGRVSAGYFETMFGGISAEVLWKPVGRKYALGAEVNYVKQRDFDQLLGFQNYSVVTGHVSGYFDLPKDFKGEIHAGRYLAGDWGATFAVNRTFNNGWKIGAFFTLTDVPFSQFGEGSFDKGITLSVPLASIFGQPSRKTADALIRPLSRDGGARLKVSSRLHGVLEGYDRPTIAAGFGKVLR